MANHQPVEQRVKPGTTVSVVVPVFNEEAVLPEFHRRLAAILDRLPNRSEIVFVNDGSTDSTLEQIRRLRKLDPRVATVDLSRNFGKEIAMTAGLDLASGDAIVIIDADLQDPPEVIPELISKWQQGFDVVYAQRTSRTGESLIKKWTAYWFYRLIRHTNRVNIPVDTGDFRLLSRRAVESLRKLRETHRFMKGLYAWIGHPQAAVRYQRDARPVGTTKFSYWRLWNFAIEGFTSFTIAPLKIATYIGVLIAGLAFVYASWIILKTLIHGDPVPGYPSLMVVVLMLGGVQLITIGILGEYVGRMFNETKQRPLYLLNEYVPAASPTSTWTNEEPSE